MVHWLKLSRGGNPFQLMVLGRKGMHRLAERLAQAEDNGGSLQKVYWNPQPDWEPGCVLTESDVGKHGYLTAKQKNPVFVVGFPATFAGKVCPKAVSSGSPEAHTGKDLQAFFVFVEKHFQLFIRMNIMHIFVIRGYLRMEEHKNLPINQLQSVK